MYEQPPQAPRQKVPKDGMGPRGFPDCYYTSRVLNSTARYAKFVKKLRALEEEQRKGAENKLKKLKDRQTSDFFISCDRKSLINNVARRVDLCMQSYQEDLKAKRARLIDLLQHEEEQNIRKFVEQAQAGAEAIWQEKKNRLKYLLEKRRKEHEEKYKDTHLSKCVHVLPCIYKLRAKEAQEIQLYQMKEKQAMREAEKEFDRMWHEVAMKESEALAARMEQDAIERYRRDQECKEYTDYQLRQKMEERERERERLKQETLWLRSIWDQDIKKEEEAERKRAENRKVLAHERKAMIAERQEALAQREANDKLINDTWDSLAGQGLADEQAKIQLFKRKERDLDECNRKMIALKQEIACDEVQNDFMFEEEARKIQEITDRRRCEYQLWSQKTNKEVRQAMIDQIKDRSNARENLTKKMKEQEDYQNQLFSQLEKLVDHQKLTDAQTRKNHQRALVEQIEYNKLLKVHKEMAQQNEADFNDLMFGLYDERPQPQQEVLESISGDSCLGTSVTRTQTDFSPQIMEYGKDFEVSCREIEKMESIFDESENVAESLKNLDLSTFDLALEKGYNDQAKICYDDTLSKGEKLKTKHVTPLDALEAGSKEVYEIDITQIDEEYCSKQFVLQQIFMLRKDFIEYLDNIEKNEFRTVMRKLKYKSRRLNKQEKQIKENISTKAKRNNMMIKEETIKIIKAFIEYLNGFETQLVKYCSELRKKGSKVEKENNNVATGCHDL